MKRKKSTIAIWIVFVCSIVVFLYLLSVNYQTNNTNELESPKNNKLSIDNSENKSSKPEYLGESKLTISAVGDLLLHMPVNHAAKNDEGYDFSYMFQDVRPYLEKADITIGNLETTIAISEDEISGYPKFKSPIQFLEALVYSGFDIITTANNHSLDGDVEGIKHTLDSLDKYGFMHVGTARSKKERDDVLIVERKGIRLAFLSYTYGCNGNEFNIENKDLDYLVNIKNMDSMKKDIKAAKDKEADAIIVSMHWGEEGQLEPNEEQKHVANMLFNEGVNVILGSHPHVIQKMQFHNKSSEDKVGKSFVVYSMGNFLSNQQKRYNDTGLIVNLEITKNFDTNSVTVSKADYIPTWVYKYIENTKMRFRILPVRDYLNNSDLSAEARKRLNEVLKETQNLVEVGAQRHLLLYSFIVSTNACIFSHGTSGSSL